METDFIKTELQKFNVADAVIAKMSAEYLPLKVEGLDDKEGFKKVHYARMVIKGKRIEVEKKRKELKESSLRFGQAVDGEAKRIIALLSPIETHLEHEESIVEKEKERLRVEAEEMARRKLQDRIERLRKCNYTRYLLDVIKNMSDVEFEVEETKAKLEYEIYEAEKERTIKATKELEVKKEQQAEIARQQTEAQNKIISERKKIEDEKRLIAETKMKEEQEKKLLVDLEKARKEAAEKARIDTENRIKRVAEAKLEAERQAEIEAKRKEALKPDKEKLLSFAATLTALKMPELLNQQATNIANRAIKGLMNIVEFIQSESNKL
mgnify:CR=1 FL=1